MLVPFQSDFTSRNVALRQALRHDAIFRNEPTSDLTISAFSVRKKCKPAPKRGASWRATIGRQYSRDDVQHGLCGLHPR